MKAVQSIATGLLVTSLIVSSVDQSYQEFGYGICEKLDEFSADAKICKKAVKDRRFPFIPAILLFAVSSGVASIAIKVD